MPRITGFSTGQTFKSEDVCATNSFDALSKHPRQPVSVGPSGPRQEPSVAQHGRRAGITGPESVPKGAGTWVREKTATLTSPAIYGSKTETPTARSTYVEHRQPRRAPITPPPSDLKFGRQKNDFRTVTMNDYPGTRGEVRTMIKPPEAKNEIFRNEWKPDFKSTAAIHHSAKEPTLGRPASEKAGLPLTTRPSYNIITGGNSMSNCRHESWESNRDYRRTRKPL